jgi:hypothetical protein
MDAQNHITGGSHRRMFAIILSALVGSVSMAIVPSARAAPPEFGQCLKETRPVGRYSTGTCTSISAGERGEYEWHPGPGAKGGFTANFGASFAPVAVLSTKSGEGPINAIECPYNVSEGEYTGPKTVTLTIILLQCHIAHAGPWEWRSACQEVGQGNRPGTTSGIGEIRMHLSGTLGFFDAGTTKEVGIELKPTTGPYLAVFECGGASDQVQVGTGTGTLLGLEGGVIEKIKPWIGSISPDYNHMLSEYRTKFVVENHVQVPEKLEGEPIDTLILATPPVGPQKTTQPALFSAEEEVNRLEEEIEINTQV